MAQAVSRADADTGWLEAILKINRERLRSSGMWLAEFHALSVEEKQVFDATRSFIEERLNRRDILGWAVKLGQE